MYELTKIAEQQRLQSGVDAVAKDHEEELKRIVAEPPKDQQIDDHVQNSALGAVKPLAEHPSGAYLMPVSLATPDAIPTATRTQPPQKTGHGIGPFVPPPLEQLQETNPKLDEETYDELYKAKGKYAKLPVNDDTKPSEIVDAEAQALNIQGAKENEQKRADDPKDIAVQTTQVVSDPPFPRVTPGIAPQEMLDLPATHVRNLPSKAN